MNKSLKRLSCGAIPPRVGINPDPRSAPNPNTQTITMVSQYPKNKKTAYLRRLICIVYF